MSEPVVYVNGRLVPASQATVSVFDRGFRMGDGVFDTARTFRHRPYKLREHVERLYRSLYYIRIDPGMTIEEMEAHTLQVVEHNVSFLQPHDDVWITQVISRGPLRTTRSANCSDPDWSPYPLPALLATTSWACR